MKIFRIMLLVMLFLSSCSDLHLGMTYQKVLLAQKGNNSIYCYCLAWAFDSEAYYISSNKNVCTGFNSTKDYCFGKGDQVIYYEFVNGTLKIYCYGTKPTIPHASLLNVEVLNLDRSSVDDYENKFTKNQIQKVVLDSFYEIPCKLVVPPIDSFTVRFESNNISK